MLASDLVEGGANPEAASILTASDSFSASPAGKVLLAKAYLGDSQPEKAIQVLQTVADPSAQMSYLLGLSYLSSHQSERALSAFRAAATTDPKDALAHYHLGALLLQDASPELQKQGAAELQTSIQLLPRQAVSYEALAKWQLQTNQANAALVLLQNAQQNTKLTAPKLLYCWASPMPQYTGRTRLFLSSSRQLSSILILPSLTMCSASVTFALGIILAPATPMRKLYA